MEVKEKKRTGNTFVTVYLILKKGDQTLLSLRKNTGYCDDFYGLVSGHVENDESATAAMIREAYEEAGIVLSPSDLKVVHIGHRKTDRFCIDVFFECTSYQGTLENKEPEKCATLQFF